MVRKSLIIVTTTIALILFVLLGRISEYLLSEFVYCRNGFAHACSDCLDQGDFPRDGHTRNIPKHIHQIFFFETDKVLPDRLSEAALSWQRENPGYGYTLWNKTSIGELIRRKYPHLEELYRSYGHWVRRADMARYIVMHQYGGWYVDIDIHCKQGLRNLSSTATRHNRSIVVRRTEPTGCSNDFIGVTPQHPFFLHVLYGLFQANRWYVFPYATTMFSTGPMFLWGRMLNYPYRQEDVHWVSNHSRYFDLMHGSSWHEWDGKIVWHFFNHGAQFRQYLLAVTCLVTMVTALVLMLRKKKCSRVDAFQRIVNKNKRSTSRMITKIVSLPRV